MVATTSSIFVGLLILYWYFQAFFGQVSKFEFFFLIGVNFVWLILTSTQWFFIFPFTRTGGLNVLNSAFKMQFSILQQLPFGYELVCFIVVFATTVYPFFYFPLLLLLSIYFPGTFHLLRHGIKSSLSHYIENPEIASNTIHVCILILLSVALGHSCVSCSILCHWMFTFYFTANQTLQTMLRAALDT